MNITILDGFTLNPGDISWNPIESLGTVKNYDRTTGDQVIERCLGADIILTNKVFISEETLEALPELKYIGVLATGINVVSMEAASQRGIVVTNIPDYSTNSVAQHTFALILEVLNQVGAHDTDIRRGGWKKRQDFSYTLSTITELANKTIGVFGWGRIGKKVAEIARAFGMKVIVHSSYPDQAEEIDFVDLNTLFQKSDVLSIHTAFTEEKMELVNIQLLQLMKPGAILINTSRGQIIRDQDLTDYLNMGKLKGAGIDVYSKEPPGVDHPLLKAKNCILTPHIAWTSKEARLKLMEIAASNIAGFQNKSPVNQVN
jgi:glycerate dehydrogenase